MVALSLQTLLLMGAAYLLGAIVACVIRRSLHRVSGRSAATSERRVDPLPEFAQSGAAQVAPARVEASQPPAKPATPSAAPGQPAQDLSRIRAIDATSAAALGKLGITRYEQIAAWMRSDIERIEQSLGQKGRVNQENWIEQAQILAKGGETQYASRRARGETANAEPTPDEGERRPRTQAAAAPARPAVTVIPRPATGGAAAVAAEIVAPKLASVPSRQPEPPTPPRPLPYTSPDVASRAAFATNVANSVVSAPKPMPAAAAVVATPTHAPEEPAVPIRPTAPAARDNLQRISGIDAQTEQRLSAQAITRYSQIAHWSPADVERFERLLGTSRRIARENWIEQAQILSRGGDTAFSREFDRRESESAAQHRPAKLADAIGAHSAVKASEGPRPELGALRSVRSEAYQGGAEPGPEAARRVASQSKVVRSAALEDLKRIRGIGVLIEKKLNSMGVVSYEQIANWSAEDIDRVSQTLDFKGRIERENWVEQARILASGGATEFSRRVDRGEIETSRSRS